jgi:hypothetical protein
MPSQTLLNVEVSLYLILGTFFKKTPSGFSSTQSLLTAHYDTHPHFFWAGGAGTLTLETNTTGF